MNIRIEEISKNSKMHLKFHSDSSQKVILFLHGGGLSLALGHYLKRHRISMPSKFLLLSPWTDLALTGESLKYNRKRDPLFGETKDSMIYQRIYLGTCKVRSPYISPLYGTFDGFPPMLIQAGEFEMLLSDSLRLAKKAEKSGVKVQKTTYPGMFHVFQMAFAWVTESRMAWKEIEQFLKKRD